MPLSGLSAKTQNELVEQELQTNTKDVTETVRLPGIATLHTRPSEEIAVVLTNLIKSRSGIKALKFVVGSHIELTFDANPMNQIR
jgi:predicted transcriptional regulator